MKIKQKSIDNFIITDRVCGEYCEKEYLYYSREEAIDLFKEDFKDLYELEAESLSDEF